MKRFLRSVLIVAALPAFAQPTSTSSGQAFPAKTLEFVVYTSPGGGTDLFARAVTDMLAREKLVTVPVIVNNRVGGGGAMAFNYTSSRTWTRSTARR